MSAQSFLRAVKPGSDKPVVGYVPGAWDMFHIGHLNLLQRARRHCDVLVVGVITDEAMLESKGKSPIIPFQERCAIVRAMRGVDEVVADTSGDKRVAWDKVHFDVIFKGSDWQGTPKGDRLEADMASLGVEVHYFPYTEQTSSTELRRVISAY